MSNSKTFSEVLDEVRRKDKERREEEAQKGMAHAAQERQKLMQAASRALDSLPDYLHPYWVEEKTQGSNGDVYLFFDFGNLAAPLTVIVIGDTAQVWGYRVGKYQEDEDGPCYYKGEFHRGSLDDAILLAAQNGAEFERLSAEYAERRKVSAAIEAAQQAAEPALDRARAAHRAYNEHLLAVIESDPVLKPLLDILFAISDERAASRSALSAAEWWANEGHSESEEQERRSRAKIDKLARELREAQDEARRADDEVMALKRKLGRS